VAMAPALGAGYRWFESSHPDCSTIPPKEVFVKISNLFAVLVVGWAACTVKDMTPPQDSVVIDTLIDTTTVDTTTTVKVDSIAVQVS